MSQRRPALRVGVGGPVGAGKTTLIAALCARLRATYELAVVIDDVSAHEDARQLARLGTLPEERVVAVDAGACAHTALEGEASAGRAAVDALIRRHPGLDIVFVEHRDDTHAGASEVRAADLDLYLIDVAGGEQATRRGDRGIGAADLLIVNKTDLAPAVGVSLMNMERDAISVRQGRPYAFTDLRGGDGVEVIVAFIIEQGMLD